MRICAHHFSHGAWLEDGALLRDADRLAGIPGVLVHGRLDMAGPLVTAGDLARTWPEAQLIVVEDAGHLGGDATRTHVLNALDRFAKQSGSQLSGRLRKSFGSSRCRSVAVGGYRAGGGNRHGTS